MPCIQLPEDRYPDDESRFRFYDQLLTSLEGTPGLQQAAITSNPPAGDGASVAYQLEGDPEAEPGTEPTGRRVVISPGYLGLLDVPILAGTGLRPSRWLRRPGFDRRDPRLRVACVAGPVGAGQAAPRLSGAASAESRRRCGRATAAGEVAHRRGDLRGSGADPQRAATAAGILHSLCSGSVWRDDHRAAIERQSDRARCASARRRAADRPRPRLGERADARRVRRTGTVGICAFSAACS